MTHLETALSQKRSHFGNKSCQLLRSDNEQCFNKKPDECDNFHHVWWSRDIINAGTKYSYNGYNSDRLDCAIDMLKLR